MRRWWSLLGMCCMAWGWACESEGGLTSSASAQSSGSGGAGGSGGSAQASGGSAGSTSGPCVNALCGTPCTAEAGEGVCDGQDSCVVVAVDCTSCGGKTCGETCLRCDPTDTLCQTVVCDEQGLCDRAANVACP